MALHWQNLSGKSTSYAEGGKIEEAMIAGFLSLDEDMYNGMFYYNFFSLLTFYTSFLGVKHLRILN